MIVGFATRGQGRGAGPVGYCVKTTVIQAKKATVTRNPPPTVLRGDPEATEQLIDSLSFKYKYKSGVLSFAPGETITPKQERDIMDRFEAVAFAGLAPDQYDILWVRHEHAGHHELHFVTPRVELTTGKSLNICPPGPKARQAYDDFRSMINAEYGLAAPDDPARVRDIQHPLGDLKLVQFDDLNLDGVNEAKRRVELREIAHELIVMRVKAQLINDRESLIEQVQSMGFQVTRASNDSITLLHPDDPDNTRFKMKGTLYESGWQIQRTAQAANEPRERDYSNRDPRAARRYAERVEGHIQRRAEYNRSRYAKPKQSLGEEHEVADFVAEPDMGGPLADVISRSLGRWAIPVEADTGAALDAAEPGDIGRGASAGAERQGVSGIAPGGNDQRDPADRIRSAVRGTNEVTNDGIGEDIARRIRAIRDAADRATEGARQCVGRVGECLTRIRGTEPASQILAAAVSRIEGLVLDHEVAKLEAQSAARIRHQQRREPEPEQRPEPKRRRPGGWKPPGM